MLRFSAVCLCCAVSNFAFADAKVSAVDKLPGGLSDKLAAALAPAGQQLVTDDGAVCTLWLAKDVATKPDFKPSLNVKYPFLTGQFIGLLRVDKASEYTDFRGNEIAAGVYTLRYGQQPVDGNHVGTSELYDFLLASPVKADSDPAPVKSVEALIKLSTQTTGSNHPAIFSLLPPAEGDKSPGVIHDESKEQWILSVSAAAGGKLVPMRVVVVGVSEG